MIAEFATEHEMINAYCRIFYYKDMKIKSTLRGFTFWPYNNNNHNNHKRRPHKQRSEVHLSGFSS